MSINRQNVKIAMELLKESEAAGDLYSKGNMGRLSINDQLAISLKVYLDRGEYQHGNIEDAIDCLILAGYEINANSHLQEMSGEFEVKKRLPRNNSIKIYGPLGHFPVESIYRLEDGVDLNQYITDSKVFIKKGKLIKKKNQSSRFEYVLWGTKIGDEDWEEQLITTAEMTPDGELKLKKAKEWAIQQGFDRLRISKNDTNIAPDFTKVLKK